MSPDYVYHMEDVLDVYELPYDPRRPVGCFDESLYQLIGETRQPLPAEPGQPTRYDYEYQRNGACNLFMAIQPLQQWRRVDVTERRTKLDMADQLRDLADVHFPAAEQIVLVIDNLTRTRCRSYMRPIRRRKPGGSRGNSRYIIPRSTGAG